jgi:alkylhydroperoxidase/carboxymuconolactone decarboxylase family protein YurZ
VDRPHEELLRRLAVHCDEVLESVLWAYVSERGGSMLDPRTNGLVRLAGCVSSGASPQSYEWCVSTALDAGATIDDVVGVLIALAPIIGVARVNRAAADIAVAIGIDIDVPGRR